MLQPNIFDDFEGDKDMANLRTLSFPNGTEVKLNRTDPYGMIEVEFINQPNPTDFGVYTSFEQAKDALARWYAEQPTKVTKK
jgi:hypothetical protein